MNVERPKLPFTSNDLIKGFTKLNKSIKIEKKQEEKKQEIREKKQEIREKKRLRPKPDKNTPNDGKISYLKNNKIRENEDDDILTPRAEDAYTKNMKFIKRNKINKRQNLKFKSFRNI